MKKINFCLVGILSILSGCATGPTYQNYSKTDAACIDGDVANFIKFFSDGEAHVRIAEVDELQANSNPVCVPPGEHKVGFTAVNSGRTVNEYITFNFEASKKYKIKANVRGIAFDCTLNDITDGTEKKLSEFRVKISGSSQAYVPIIIPSN